MNWVTPKLHISYPPYRNARACVCCLSPIPLIRSVLSIPCSVHFPFFTHGHNRQTCTLNLFLVNKTFMYACNTHTASLFFCVICTASHNGSSGTFVTPKMCLNGREGSLCYAPIKKCGCYVTRWKEGQRVFVTHANYWPWGVRRRRLGSQRSHNTNWSFLQDLGLHRICKTFKEFNPWSSCFHTFSS